MDRRWSTAADLVVPTLGTPRIDSPLGEQLNQRLKSFHYAEESDRVLLDDTLSALIARDRAPADLPGFEPAGPRRKIYFDPYKSRAGIVTCGGLCPGLNDVIRGLTLELRQRYGVQHVYGFCNGFQGFIAKFRRSVHRPHRRRASPTSTSSAAPSSAPRAASRTRPRWSTAWNTWASTSSSSSAATAPSAAPWRIVKEITARGDKIAVVGIPKTIDNDIMFIDQSFGFQTAFSEATKSLRAAHVESTGAPNGIGLVKLMGRHSGFIACYASLAMSDVNFVLIPEVPFQLEGDCGLLERPAPTA